MKFSKDSCNIPDELIIAHQEGKVVFFCGAGVSIGAGLPDFWQLAESVVCDLRVSQNSEAKKFYDTSKSFKEQHPSLTSITTADQLFSFLELEFLSEDIECSVLKALKPKDNADTSNHKIMLGLARTSSGKTQLVTTNFDRCFESFGYSPKQCWIAPNLPDLDRGYVLDGIVYLHGRANENYTSSDGHEVVLNTADFGNAYISNGWATRLFKQILERFVVVFVGYSADDPPINFLLRGLKKYRSGLNKIYAFEHGKPQEVRERWSHKGVEAIPFPQGDYQCLWHTLDAWSEFHKNTSSWYAALFRHASKGPSQLEPYEREQVAFLAKTIDGAKRILNSEPQLPAEWLCVFDQNRRYAERQTFLMDDSPPPPSPFAFYGLDSDPPAQVNGDVFSQNSILIPRNAWHGLGFSSDEISALPVYQRHSITDGLSGNHQLSERLHIIGAWIAKSYKQLSCLWWAHLQKQPLHESIVRRIEHSLNYDEDLSDSDIRDSWRKLLAVWRDRELRENKDWYLLKRRVERDGWFAQDIQCFSDLMRPRLVLTENWHNGIAPTDADRFKINLRIQFSKQHIDISIPDLILGEIVATFRNNIDYAFALAKLNKTYLNEYLDPIGADESIKIIGRYDLGFLVTNYISLFLRLDNYSPEIAYKEFISLKVSNSAICVIKLFISQNVKISPLKLFESLINIEIPTDFFWRESVLPSLLGVVKNRWHDLSCLAKKTFTQRLIKGPVKPSNISDSDWSYLRAFKVLNAIQWMEDKGCKLVGISKNLKLSLMNDAPDWNPSCAEIEPYHRAISGVIRNNPDWDILRNKSTAEIINFLEDFIGRDHLSLIENDPFTGLSRDKPLKALRVLLFPKVNFCYDLWRKFLSPAIRKEDSPKLISIIARKIMNLSFQEIHLVEYSIFAWFKNFSHTIYSFNSELHRNITDKLYEFVLNQDSPELYDGQSDLINHAINVPVGIFVESIIYSPDKNEDFLDVRQLAMLSSLLHKSGIDGCLALVLCASQIPWFYSRCPSWAKLNLIDKSYGDNASTLAFWEGFLWSENSISADLFNQIKAPMLQVSLKNSGVYERLAQRLSDHIVIGWLQNFIDKSSASISNDELFEFLVSCSDDMRVFFLSNFRSRIDSNQSDVDWKKSVTILFSEVWPKQKQVKTISVNSELCSFIFAMKLDFSFYFDLIFPHLHGFINNFIELPYVSEENFKESYLFKFSDLILKLFVKVLPYDFSDWPYRVEEYILIISKVSDDEFMSDDLVELIGRINRR